MSSLTGHRSLTRFAVNELVRESPNDPILSSLKSANLQNHAVLRDLYDVISMGHWLNFGQKHHFMRRFDGQKPYAAYTENVEWIRSNALTSAVQLQQRVLTKYAPMAAQGKPALPGQTPTAEQRLGGKLAFDGGDGDGVSWQEFGNACHALQDSFAEGHAVRVYPWYPVNAPGMIDDVLVYADDEKYKKAHHELDEGWHVADDEHVLSPVGTVAKNGTKALIRMVVRTAMNAQGGKAPTQLDGWNDFQRLWLTPSPALVTRDPDAAIRLIRRYSLGVTNGLPLVGHATFNMDEEGLAKALVTEFGDDTRSVHAAFLELEKNHSADSDDVAIEYVKLVRAGSESVRFQLKYDRALKVKLIEILEDGWTTSEESDAIKWLWSL